MTNKNWYSRNCALFFAYCITIFVTDTFASTLFLGRSLPAATCAKWFSVGDLRHEGMSRSTKMLPKIGNENLWYYQSILKTPQDYLARRGIPTTYGPESFGDLNYQEVLGVEDFTPPEVHLMKQILEKTPDKDVQKKVAQINQWSKYEKRPQNIPDEYFEVGGFIISLKNGETYFLLHTSYERTQVSSSEVSLADFMKSKEISFGQIALIQSFHNHPNGIPILSSEDFAHKNEFLRTMRRLTEAGTGPIDWPVVHFYSFSKLNGFLVIGHSSHDPYDKNF